MRENGLLSRRTQASKTRFAVARSSENSRRQAGSASPPSPGNAHRTCPGSILGTKLGCRFRDLGWSEHASLPWGLGPTLPGEGTSARPQITLLLSASSRPRRPGREPAVSPHRPWQSGRAATLPPTCLGSTIPHINNPSPLATTSPPFASLKLSSHLQPPLETTRCQGNEGGRPQHGLCGFHSR